MSRLWESALLDSLSAWLAAYWIHAAVLHGCALLIARRPRMTLRARERLWRAALLLPIVTATAVQLDTHTSLRSALESARAEPVRVTVQSQVSRDGAITSDVHVSSAGQRLMGFVCLCFLVIGIPATTLHVRRLRRWTRVRSGARDGDDDFADCSLEIDAKRRARVRLADMPPEMGIGFAAGRRDIVLSGDALAELSMEHRRAVLAHEIAHQRRRDPIWFGVGAWVSSILAFQPSARLIMSRMRRDAEFACDRLAVAEVGSLPLYLECLVTLATRFDPCERPAFASSLVVQRAERLVEGEPASEGRAWPSLAILAAASVLVAWAAPARSRSAPIMVSSAVSRPSDAVASGDSAAHGTTVVVRVETARGGWPLTAR